MPDIPPGHRILLSKFVKDVRKQVNPYSKISKPHTKDIKAKDTRVTAVSSRSDCPTDIDHDVDLADTTSKIRKQIVTWQHAQNNIHLRQLKEHTEYRVIVEPSTSQCSSFCAAILCTMCDKKVYLGVSSNKLVKLSNWIRHVKGCVRENRGKQKSQLALTKYFSLHSDTSLSDVLNPASASELSSPHSPPTHLTKSPIHHNSPPSIRTSEGSPTVTDTDGEYHKNSTSNEQGFRLAPPIIRK